ncbi:MAG: PqqD family protein [Bacteroidales bacterium]|nr:PqqD family protein [Bacteroidales bacterium]MCM1147717.1 PqqD family protein [Bacteroidales bacterium]MCM1206673.1 PqqD family protein [Bacillota bacterium]MCM1510586.1 PqqD family protein [Clostridium sp.]
MKKKPGFVLRSVCGEQFLISEGDENIDFSNLISLNESSAFLWSVIDDGREFTVETLVNALLSEYEVSRDQAQKDIEQLCKEMLDAGIISS